MIKMFFFRDWIADVYIYYIYSELQADLSI